MDVLLLRMIIAFWANVMDRPLFISVIHYKYKRKKMNLKIICRDGSNTICSLKIQNLRAPPNHPATLYHIYTIYNLHELLHLQSGNYVSMQCLLSISITDNRFTQCAMGKKKKSEEKKKQLLLVHTKFSSAFHLIWSYTAPWGYWLLLTTISVRHLF